LKHQKRLIIVSEFVDDEINSTGLYWNKIIRSLLNSNATIEVISSTSSLARSNFENLGFVCHGVNPPQFASKKLFSRIINKSLLSISILLRMIRVIKRKDIVFTGTNPNILLLLTTLLNKVTKFKWILLVHDIFPENTIPAKILKGSSLLYKMLFSLYQYVYSTPIHLITIGRDMLKLMKEKTNSRVSFIPNFADPKILNLKHDKKENEYISFFYSGNLGELQDLENIFLAFKYLSSKDKKFLFSGNGSKKNKIKELCKQYKEFGVKFIENDIDQNSADISLVPLKSGMYGLAVPSKAYFSLAYDKPLLVIGDYESELAMMINENNDVGWFVEAGNPKKLAALIDSIEEKQLQRMKGKPRQLAEKKYNFEIVSLDYQRVIGEYL